ncbi:hypothetical protein L7F22_007364 [Adiantum nelumboides]|nr:hypothetical protein [Adiantum nelumboides]
MEDVAPRRRRAQRSPTPPKQKRSPHNPHRRKSKREEKSSKKKKERKRSPSSPSSSLSSSSDENNDILGELPPKRGDDDHMIELIPGSSPLNKPPYRVSHDQQKEIMRQVNELVEKGMVRPSSSPFCSPVLLVQKKDDTYRMCVDYRALNRITIKNRFPVPQVEDLQGSTYFSRIDLKSGYHHIRIVDEDIVKTAFCTTFGLYEYLVMPFGLTNAPATFNRMMEKIFQPHHNFAGVFFDDAIIYSKIIEEHKGFNKPWGIPLFKAKYNNNSMLMGFFHLSNNREVLGETSKRGLSTEKGVENPYQELKQFLESKPSSKKKGHVPHEGSPSKEREGSESQDEIMEDVAPRRRRAQRSPTPPKQKRSPRSPPHCISKKEEKDSKKKKEKKRSPSSPSSSPSFSLDESGGYSSKESSRRGHRRSQAAWRRSNKLKKL